MRGRRRSILALGMLVSCVYPAFTAIASETITYGYDADGRLIQASRSGTVNNGIIACYAYDKADNRSNVTVGTSSCPSLPPSFSISDISVTEGGGLVLTVTKNGASTASFSVNYATANGTAASGSDYTAVSGTLTFAAADPTKTITISTTDDTTNESAETVLVNLSAPTGGAVISDGQGIGTINDNDAAPSFSIDNVSVTEGGSLVLTVTKTGSTSNSFSVNYATANGTAASGSDYTAGSGTITFAAADTAKTITIATINDVAVESAETVLVNLSSATGGATISDSQGVGTINDNDVAPTCSGVSFAVSDDADDEGIPLVFTITKSGSATGSCSVNYASADGTAITPNDYAAASGTLTFAQSETTKTVSITTGTGGPSEADEYMYLNLSGPTGSATVSDPQGVGTIYNYYDDGGGGCPLC